MREKYIFVFTLIASLFMITIPAQADPMYIDLISQSCSTQGINEDHPNVIPFSWNESGTSSVSVSYIDPYYPVLVGASINVGESTAYLDAYTDIIWSGGVLAEIRFRPIGASYIDISFHTFTTGKGAPAMVELIDETTSESMLDFYYGGFAIYGENVYHQYFDENSPGFPFGLYLNNLLFPVDPSHIYDLSTKIMVAHDDGAEVSASISLVVPEPATMLFLGLGLVGLAGYGRRKFFKK